MISFSISLVPQTFEKDEAIKELGQHLCRFLPDTSDVPEGEDPPKRISFISTQRTDLSTACGRDVIVLGNDEIGTLRLDINDRMKLTISNCPDIKAVASLLDRYGLRLNDFPCEPLGITLLSKNIVFATSPRTLSSTENYDGLCQWTDRCFDVSDPVKHETLRLFVVVGVDRLLDESDKYIIRSVPDPRELNADYPVPCQVLVKAIDVLDPVNGRALIATLESFLMSLSVARRTRREVAKHFRSAEKGVYIS